MMKRSSPLAKTIIWIIVSIWLIVCLFPLYNMVATTFSSDSSDLTRTFFPNDIPNGLTKIEGAFTTAKIGDSALSTLSYVALATFGMLVVCSLVAYEFTFYKFPLRNALYGLVIGSMMFPLVLYVIPLYRFVTKLGLSDTVAGIAFPMMVSPLSVFILMQFLEDLPVSFIESARIDGASHFKIFSSIVFPLMRNGLLTAGSLMFVNTWGSYLWPSLMSGANIKPMSVTIANMLSPQFYIDSRIKIAAMVLSAIPPLAIYLVFQRYIITGITMSGVKG